MAEMRDPTIVGTGTGTAGGVPAVTSIEIGDSRGLIRFHSAVVDTEGKLAGYSLELRSDDFAAALRMQCGRSEECPASAFGRGGYWRSYNQENSGWGPSEFDLSLGRHESSRSYVRCRLFKGAPGTQWRAELRLTIDSGQLESLHAATLQFFRGGNAEQGAPGEEPELIAVAGATSAPPSYQIVDGEGARVCFHGPQAGMANAVESRRISLCAPNLQAEMRFDGDQPPAGYALHRVGYDTGKIILSASLQRDCDDCAWQALLHLSDPAGLERMEEELQRYFHG